MAIRFTEENANFLLEKFYLADFVLWDNLDKTKSYAFLSKRFNSFIGVVYSRCEKFSVGGETWSLISQNNLTILYWTLEISIWYRLCFIRIYVKLYVVLLSYREREFLENTILRRNLSNCTSLSSQCLFLRTYPGGCRSLCHSQCLVKPNQLSF